MSELYYVHAMMQEMRYLAAIGDRDNQLISDIRNMSDVITQNCDNAMM